MAKPAASNTATASSNLAEGASQYSQCGQGVPLKPGLCEFDSCCWHNIMDEKIIEFLRESNNIEDEWSDLFLQQAIFAWNYLITQKELTTEAVLKTHKILSLHSNLPSNQ